MKEQLISFETAKLAKEKGFNEYCKLQYVETLEHTIESHHNGNEYTISHVLPRPLYISHLSEHDIPICNAPTQALLQKWLREIHNIHVCVNPYTNPAKGVDIIYYELFLSHKDNSFEGSLNNSCLRLTESLKTKKPSYVGLYNTYELALEEGLKNALNLIKTE